MNPEQRHKNDGHLEDATRDEENLSDSLSEVSIISTCCVAYVSAAFFVVAIELWLHVKVRSEGFRFVESSHRFPGRPFYNADNAHLYRAGFGKLFLKNAVHVTIKKRQRGNQTTDHNALHLAGNLLFCSFVDADHGRIRATHSVYQELF